MQPMTAQEIAGMRATSASALPDVCTITRPATEGSLNEATLVWEPGESMTVYTGPCRVRPRDSQEEDVQVGDLHQTLGPYVGTLPATTTDATTQAPAGVTVQGDPDDIAVDDFLTVTASWDAAMVGRSLRVVHIGWSAWQIDRRIGLQDREQPAGVEAGS